MKKILLLVLCVSLFLMTACTNGADNSNGNSAGVSDNNSQSLADTNSDSLSETVTDSLSETVTESLSEIASESQSLFNSDGECDIPDEMSPYFVGVEAENTISCEDVFWVKVAPSLWSFPVDNEVDELKLFVSFSDGKQLCLDTFKAEEFTQEVYGCTTYYNTNDYGEVYISQIEYHYFKEYFIPTELLLNEGWLRFELWTYGKGIRYSGGFSSVLYYVYQNNTLHFLT